MNDPGAALKELEIADQHWGAAIEASEFAAPDDQFAERIRDIARAAGKQADALARADAVAKVSWTAAPGAHEMILSYELRPGGNRPGPTELWDRFDQTVETLGTAMEGTQVRPVADAFDALADIGTQLAAAIDDERERIRRRAG